MRSANPRCLGLICLMAMFRVCMIWVAMIWTAVPALANQDAPTEQVSGPNGPIVAFGDVHGGVRELTRLLRSLEIIDDAGDWSGGNTRLVSLGDLLDRGDDSRQVMDLLLRLENQAPAAGGAFHMVLGNHEIMNLTGDLRYVAAGEFAAFAGDSSAPEPEGRPDGFEAHRAAFAADGKYGRWLLEKPQVLVLDGTAFVHGGLSEHFATESIDSFNRRSRMELKELLSMGAELTASGVLPESEDLLTAVPLSETVPVPEAFLALRETLSFTATGPTWYRGTASCHPVIESPGFERVMAARGLGRVVIGHTPTNPRIIQSRFGGRAILADTGMLASHYRGWPSALIINGGEVSALTLNRAGDLTPYLGRPAIDRRSQDQLAAADEIRAFLETSERVHSDVPVELEIGGRPFLGHAEEGRKRDVSNRLAALALDAHLQLGLVAPIVAFEGEGFRGTVEARPARSISELERVAQQRHRPNSCVGSSDYQLMYALDALMGIQTRDAQTLFYDPVSWLMYLSGHENAFGNSSRLPRYLDDVTVQVPEGLATRLASLDADGLEQLLGAYLNERARNALLARRDRILAL